MTNRGFVLVISLQPLSATTTLFFGERLCVAPEALRVVQYGRDDVVEPLGAASGVVLVRGLFEFSDIARCALALGIPLYYFVDDNFIVLREHGGIGAAFVAQYSADNVRAALSGFAGVLLATPPLMDYFRDERLHPHLFLFPPAAGASARPTPAAPRPSLHVAFFGGQHLHRMLLGTVVPAIRRLARETPVTLFAVGVPESIEPSTGLAVVHLAYDESYARGLSTLADRGVDVLVHPVAPGLANNAFKNPHALISAHTLGAVPVVSDAPPYQGLGSEQVALLCRDSEESWHDALASVAVDERLRSTMHARLASYCAAHFGGAPNREVLDRILSEHRPPGRGRRAIRRALARTFLLTRLASRVAARVTRGLAPAVVTAAA